MNRLNAPIAREFLKALEECVEKLRKEATDEEPDAFRKEAQQLIQNLDDEDTFLKLVSLAGIKDDELPEKMERINEILDVLPRNITEYMLIEFLNNLLIYSDKE